MKHFIVVALLLLLSQAGLAADTAGTSGRVESKSIESLRCVPQSLSLNITQWCPEVSIFDPSARIYFDTGTDDVGEIDIFDDGSLNATIDFVSLYFPFKLFQAYADRFSWGPSIGVGISGPAQDSDDGTTEASSAPVFLLTTGLAFNIAVGDTSSTSTTRNSLVFEVGRAIGFSADESFGDNNDSATYVGFKLNINF